MKNIFKPLLILLVAVSFASCSTDEEISNNTNDTSGDLIGTWELVSIDFDGTGSTDIQGQEVGVDIIGESQNANYIVNFTESEFETEGSYDLEITVTTLLGLTETTVNESIEDASVSGAYSRDGNTINLESALISIGDDLSDTPNMGSQATITELTETTLRLVVEITQEQTINEMPATITVLTETVFNRL